MPKLEVLEGAPKVGPGVDPNVGGAFSPLCVVVGANPGVDEEFDENVAIPGAEGALPKPTVPIWLDVLLPKLKLGVCVPNAKLDDEPMDETADDPNPVLAGAGATCSNEVVPKDAPAVGAGEPNAKVCWVRVLGPLVSVWPGAGAEDPNENDCDEGACAVPPNPDEFVSA